MRTWLKGALLACAAMIAAEPANAQFFNFFDDDAPRARPRASQSQRAAQRPAAARSQPQRVRAYASTPWSSWNDDDDDDRPQRRSAQPRLGPALLDGGARPSIAAATPATVPFVSGYAPGSIVIDSGGRALYYVQSSSSAYRYPIAVGREGFSWTGTETVSRKAAWPDWHPPLEMRQRDPRLPEKMTGGVNNPLGAMAIYLGNTLYRIHGTNDARTIGGATSSGCFRMTNSHVLHLSSLVGVGATVHVVARLPSTVRRNVAGL